MADEKTPQEKAAELGVPLLEAEAEELKPADVKPVAVCAQCGVAVPAQFSFRCMQTACPVMAKAVAIDSRRRVFELKTQS